MADKHWTEDDLRSRLGISTNCFWPDKCRLDGRMLARISEAGIVRIELAADLSDHFDHNDRGQVREVKKACENLGIEIASYHAPNVSLDYHTISGRRAVVAETETILNTAAELGASVVVWHDMMVDDEVISIWREVFAKLSGSSIRAATENGERLEDYAMDVDRVGLDRFGMIVDIGHTRDADGVNPMTKPGRAREAIRICGKRLFHLHLHEFHKNADHWPPFYGDAEIQWGELFAGLADIGYRGAFMFESVSPRPNDPSGFDENLRRVASFPAEFTRRYGH